MKKKVAILVLLGAVILTACRTTTVTGKQNEKYEPPKTEAVHTEMTEESTERHFTYTQPLPQDVPEFYTKIRLPGVKPILYAYSDEAGAVRYYVFGRFNDGYDDFHEIALRKVDAEVEYTLLLENALEKPNPGRPRSTGEAVDSRQVLAHWQPVEGRNNTYFFIDENGEYLYRRWAAIGDVTGFYPCSDYGVLILGGIPDQVKISDQYILAKVIDPVTFVKEEPEDTEIRFAQDDDYYMDDIYVGDYQEPDYSSWTEYEETVVPKTEASVTEVAEDTEMTDTEASETELTEEPADTEPTDTEETEETEDPEDTEETEPADSEETEETEDSEDTEETEPVNSETEETEVESTEYSSETELNLVPEVQRIFEGDVMNFTSLFLFMWRIHILDKQLF